MAGEQFANRLAGIVGQFHIDRVAAFIGRDQPDITEPVGAAGFRFEHREVGETERG